MVGDLASELVRLPDWSLQRLARLATARAASFTSEILTSSPGKVLGIRSHSPAGLRFLSARASLFARRGYRSAQRSRRRGTAALSGLGSC